MNVYKISAANIDYNQFDSIIAAARNQEEAMRIAKNAKAFGDQDPLFERNQYPLSVSEINVTKPGIIHRSYVQG